MTELVLDNSNPNLFPSSRRKSKIYGSDEELKEDDLGDLFQKKVSPQKSPRYMEKRN